jgi:hypothetical protein
MTKTGKRFGTKKILQDKEKIDEYVAMGRIPKNEQFTYSDQNGEISLLNIEQIEAEFDHIAQMERQAQINKQEEFKPEEKV